MGQFSIAETEYKGWKNCLRLSNSHVDMIVTLDVGPRIISYGFTNGRNELCVWEEQAGLTGGPEWRCYGGSRLWHGPEIGKRCYEPDNEPVEYRISDDGIVLKQKVENWTKIAKETKITFLGGAKIQLDYKITNTSPWDAELCIWVLTLMDSGGSCIIPAPKQIRGIAPNSVLPAGAIAFWPYTSLHDPRFSIGEKFYRLDHDPQNTQNFKIGMPVFEGWVAYYNDSNVFLKYFEHFPEQHYPDYCSSFELYCCERYTEVETLSPMKKLKEGESLKHKEIWDLHSGVPHPATEKDIIDKIVPLLNRK